MNQIERLQGDLAKRFPELTTEIDAPAEARGPWFLDVRRGDVPVVVVEWRPDRGFGVSAPGGGDYGSGPDDVRRGDVPVVVVEWRPDRGFGVSAPGGGDYGSGPDEVYPNTRAAFDRIVRLILAGGRTEPTQAVRLAALRQILGLSQGELAERTGVRQANISRIESRGDLKVSTLAKLVAAMGGSLSIRARFPDGVERELEV